MAASKKPEAKIISKKRVYDGFHKLYECEIEMDKHDGGKQTVTHLVLEQGRVVSVLAYDPVRDEVLLVNQMRAGPLLDGAYPFNDGLPGGAIDKGEDLLKAANREMLEETGVSLKDTVVIHPGAYASSGGSTQNIALVFGIVDTSKAGGIHGEADEGENINTVIIKSKEFIRRSGDGSLKNMTSLTAAFWFAQNRDRIRKQYKTNAKKKPGPRV